MVIERPFEVQLYLPSHALMIGWKFLKPSEHFHLLSLSICKEHDCFADYWHVSIREEDGGRFAQILGKTIRERSGGTIHI